MITNMVMIKCSNYITANSFCASAFEKAVNPTASKEEWTVKVIQDAINE
jgi:hypothetical protein